MKNGYLDRLNEEQETALQSLQRFPIEAIQWFLIYARSVESPPQDQQKYLHCTNILTKEELGALWILRDCPDDLMSPGLNPRDGYQNDDLWTSSETPKASCWCTYCSPPRRFRRKDGWARHEREKHEEHLYPCMPNGAIEMTEQGPVCAICKTSDPDKTHLDKHNIGSCVSNPWSTNAYKRRIDLVNHLKHRHGISNGQGLAEHWKRAPDKKAWACGFCVKYFPQRMDRINHIYAEHYAQGTDMRSWDAVKVIWGLLRQPRLWDAWSEYLLAKYSLAPTELTWHASVVKSLQRRLEMGEESPEVLVAAAYEQSNLGSGVWGNGPLSFSVDTNADPTAFDAMAFQFPQTSIAPPDSSYDYNGSDIFHEPGSSDTKMRESPNIDDSYMDPESSECSIKTFEPHVFQMSRRSSQRLNDKKSFNYLMDDDKPLPGPGFFEDAYSDAIANA